MAWDSISVNGIAQPLDQIFQNTSTCPNALFAFWMNPNTNGVTGGGEMTLCSIDSSKYQVRMRNVTHKHVEISINFKRGIENLRIKTD